MSAAALAFEPSAAVRLQVIELGEGGATEPGPGVIQLAVQRGGGLPVAPAEFDVLLTTAPNAPRPWVSLAPGEIDTAIAELRAAVERNPTAALCAAQVLRISPRVSFSEALVVESLAYSMLLASREFKAWRAQTPVRSRPAAEAPRVRLSRENDALVVTLARAGARNAVDAAMRDELVEALEFAKLDPEAGPVLLRGEGPSFSAGGDLDEFGQADDAALAHVIRVQQYAVRLVHELGERMQARVHGACIGAGVEIPAGASRIIAAPDAWFRLPEVSMGLIPGAGGTASIPRRIGRERACFMALSGRPIEAPTALAWGLVDELEAEP